MEVLFEVCDVTEETQTVSPSSIGCQQSKFDLVFSYCIKFKKSRVDIENKLEGANDRILVTGIDNKLAWSSSTANWVIYYLFFRQCELYLILNCKYITYSSSLFTVVNDKKWLWQDYPTTNSQKLDCLLLISTAKIQNFLPYLVSSQCIKTICQN